MLVIKSVEAVLLNAVGNEFDYGFHSGNATAMMMATMAHTPATKSSVMAIPLTQQ
jgi:hypothetical protein